MPSSDSTMSTMPHEPQPCDIDSLLDGLHGQRVAARVPLLPHERALLGEDARRAVGVLVGQQLDDLVVAAGVGERLEQDVPRHRALVHALGGDRCPAAPACSPRARCRRRAGRSARAGRCWRSAGCRSRSLRPSEYVPSGRSSFWFIVAASAVGPAVERARRRRSCRARARSSAVERQASDGLGVVDRARAVVGERVAVAHLRRPVDDPELVGAGPADQVVDQAGRVAGGGDAASGCSCAIAFSAS